MLKRAAFSTVVLACVAATASGALAGRDTDHDGLGDHAEVHRYHTNPHRRDTDRDGLSDRAEIRRYHTNPRKKDTDRDGLSDRAEILSYHTNPRKKDTDRDGFSDGAEVRAGTNPRAASSHPSMGSAPAAAPGSLAPTPSGEPGPPSGFPNSASTGVPAGTSLTAYAGPAEISTPGTVIDGKTMGCVVVRAPGVVIRNSRILCANTADAVMSPDGVYTGTPLLIEDSEIDCKNTGGTGVGDTNITARRLNIHGCENGFDIDANVTVQDSYIHDMYNSAAAHTDGIQFAPHLVSGQVVPGSVNVTISHNTIYGVGVDGSFGTSAIITNHGGDANILIQDNLLAGGAFTLYCEQGATGTNYRVLNNHFSRKFGTKVGAYGPSTDCSDETQSGNVIHETLQPLSLD